MARRKSRFAMAAVAVLIGAAIAGALMTVSMNVRDQVGQEFRQYGANILLVPKSNSISVTIGDVDYGAVTEQKYIEEDDLDKITEIFWANNILGYAPYLYGIASAEGHNVVLSGVWFDQIMKVSPWWDVEGNWVRDRNDTSGAMIGRTVADKLGLSVGSTLDLAYSDVNAQAQRSLVVTGIVTTGGSEDEQVFANLDMVQEFTFREGKVSTVQVSALCTGCPVEEIAGQIEQQIPYIEAKSVKSVVNAEMNILGKIEEMMGLVALVALLASALGVTTTMTASVIERTKEIGLMKALGAENRNIAAMFFAEAGMVGAVGGVAGYGAGLLVAQFIGITVFGSYVSPYWTVFPVVVGISIGVAVLASAIPIRTALGIEPAKVLRGD